MSGTIGALTGLAILTALGGLGIAMWRGARPWALAVTLALGVLATALLPPAGDRDHLVQRSLIGVARMLARHGRAGAAVDLFRATRQARGADGATLGAWGELLVAAGEPRAATQAFEQAIGLVGPGTPLHLGAARAWLAAGDPRAALNHLGRLYQHHGGEPVVGFLTGRALQETGNHGAARRALERAWRALDRGGTWLWKPDPAEVADAFDRLAAIYHSRGWDTLEREVLERKRRAVEPSG